MQVILFVEEKRISVLDYHLNGEREIIKKNESGYLVYEKYKE